VKLHAKVNLDKTIQESNYGNNDKIISAKVGQECGALAAQTSKKLSIRVYDSPNTSPRPGLYVEVRNGSFIRVTNIGNTGTAQVEDVPSGSCNIIVNQGTAVLEDRTYVMPGYDASLNIVLD
jgi:hypothetical protein